MFRIIVLVGMLLTAESAAAADWTKTRFKPAAADQTESDKSERIYVFERFLRDNLGLRPALKRCEIGASRARSRFGFTLDGQCKGDVGNPVFKASPRESFGLLGDPSFTQRLVGLDVDGKFYNVLYGDPTDRYDHGVFGEKLEGSTLRVEPLGFERRPPLLPADHGIELPQTQVFEDRTPRVTDLEGFGRTHIVTILTEVTQGASVAVFGLADDKLTLLAQSPYIGTPNRWLNIAGIEDFDGSGSAAIALVETPHIGGTLQFWRWVSDREGGGSLKLVAEEKDALGYSNHVFGSREQRLSAVEDFDGDGVSDLALPSQDRRTLRLVKVEGDEITDIATVPLPSPIDKAIGVTNVDGDVVLTVGLEDGSVWAVHRTR